MSKFKVEKSLEHAGFWSLYTGTDLTTEKLYKTRAEAMKAAIDNQFLNEHFEFIDLTKKDK
jgi:hypothetical protein